MANRVFEGPISLHHGTAAAFAKNNPVLVLAELGIETDSLRYKLGDGDTPWNDLPYASGPQFLIHQGAPTAADAQYEVGSMWLNSASNRVHILTGNDAGAAIWSPLVTLSDIEELSGGDMLKAEYATGDVPGTVDAAVKADRLSVARMFTINGDVNGTASSDLSGNLTITTELGEVGTPGTYVKVTTDDTGRVVSGEQQLTASDIPNLTLSKISDAGTAAAVDVGLDEGNVPILDADGRLPSSVMPDLSLMNRFEIPDEHSFNTLSGVQLGDIAITPTGVSFMYVGGDSDKDLSWVRISTDPDAVTMINGEIGPVVNLTTTKIQEGVNLYFTEERVEAVIAQAHVADLADGSTVLRTTDSFAWDGGQEV